MDTVYACTKDEDSLTADIQCFYLKSKVPICLAITESFYFLTTLKEACFLSEEEVLELQGDTRTVHRVVYECLCWIEEKDKDISLPNFFELLFKKSFLRKYPDLRPIQTEYKEGKYQHGMYSTPDKEKDSEVFAKDKVKICLAITDRFPFLHGLQDLAILSETESLKLQADERPVSRVIYESLSLIEKKDLKLNVVFEYIFQTCYLKLYPGLQDILREPNGDAPFNGEQYPKFNIATDLPEFFEHNKTYICKAVNERFPFLHGLHDYGLLSYIQLLRLQADTRSTIDVLEEALSHIQTISDIKSFFAYVLQEFYLKLYPSLHITLNSLNAALTLDVCLPSPVSCTEKSIQTQDDNTPFTVSYEDEIRDIQEQESNGPFRVNVINDRIAEFPDLDFSEPSPVSYKDEITVSQEQDSSEPSRGSEGTLPSPVRKCRLQPISYSEPPDLICEMNNTEKKHRVCSNYEDPENAKHHKFHKRKVQDTGKYSWNLKEKSEPGQGIHYYWNHNSPSHRSVTKHLTVRVEFPKQVFNETFQVRCGDKKGIFKKANWTGHTRHDKCIISEGKKFSVTAFEKYGGRGASKNWKKSIQCGEIKLESLIKAGILRRPIGMHILRTARAAKKKEAAMMTDQTFKLEENCATRLEEQIQKTRTYSEKIKSVHNLLSLPQENITFA